MLNGHYHDTLFEDINRSIFSNYLENDMINTLHQILGLSAQENIGSYGLKYPCNMYIKHKGDTSEINRLKEALSNIGAKNIKVEPDRIDFFIEYLGCFDIGRTYRVKKAVNLSPYLDVEKLKDLETVQDYHNILTCLELGFYNEETTFIPRDLDLVFSGLMEESSDLLKFTVKNHNKFFLFKTEKLDYNMQKLVLVIINGYLPLDIDTVMKPVATFFI